MLDVMNVPLILHNLRKRFNQNEIYTNVGTMLISVSAATATEYQSHFPGLDILIAFSNSCLTSGEPLQAAAPVHTHHHR